MMGIIRQGGPAVAGVIAIVFGCAPRSVQLEHQPATGGEGDGAAANTSGAGGASSGKSGGGASGKAQGGAGRGGAGAGAPVGAAGADSGGEPATGGTAGKGPTENGGVKNSCESGVLTDVRNGHDLLPGYVQARDPRVEDWLASMSLEDQISQMEGVNVDPNNANYYDIMRSGDRMLGDGTLLRGYSSRDGVRGVNLDAGQLDRPSDGNDFSTAFPTPSIRGASWDLDLEWLIGDAIGDETTASMNTLLIGPNVDVIRHPFWGRTQDSYGEDTYHVGRMGTAFVAGVQRHVGACASHFIGNGVEQLRARQDALVDEQSLREIYARPFEMVVRDGGVACVMAAYNKVNGVKATVNGHLLQDILKAPVDQGGFGFRGFVISDWWALPGDQVVADPMMAQATAVAAANAGLDVELPWILNYDYLAAAVAVGAVSPTVIAGAAGRVLEQKARFHSVLINDGYGLTPSSSTLTNGSITTNLTHLALAERAELESAVLLSNGVSGPPVLPIPSGIDTIAVIGAEVPLSLISTTPPKSGDVFHFATDVAVGDRGSSRVNADPAQSVGPYAGIQAAASAHGGVEVTTGTSAADGADADLLVVVVGYTPGDEGEEYAIPAGGDRWSLSLPTEQLDLLNDALSLGKPTVIVIESGSVVSLPWLDHGNRNQATIWAGNGGMRAGTALGKLLFGDASFSGKLTMAWAAESALPAFKDDVTDAVTTQGYFIGYREYDRRSAGGDEVDVVFPFGHGLSYTTFGYSNLQVPCSEVTTDAVVDVTADITNTGSVPGDEVAFLFVAGPPGSGDPRSQKELKSFARVSLAPGATERVHLPVRIQDLKHWSTATSSWVIDPGEYTVLVGSSGSDDDLTVAGTFTLPG